MFMSIFENPHRDLKPVKGVLKVKGHPTVVRFYVHSNAIQGQMLTVSIAAGAGCFDGPLPATSGCWWKLQLLPQ